MITTSIMDMTKSQIEILSYLWLHRYNVLGAFCDVYDVISSHGRKAYFTFKTILNHAGCIMKDGGNKLKAEVILEPPMANKIKLDYNQELLMKELDKKVLIKVLKRKANKNNELFVKIVMYASTF